MPEVKKTPEQKAAEKKALQDKRAAEEKRQAEQRTARAKEAEQRVLADKQAADKQAAAKKKAEQAKQQAQRPQQAKKPAPKKPSVYAPFETLGEFTNNQVLCNARFSPCGKYVIAGGTTGQVHRWELVEAKPEATADAEATTAAAPPEFKPLSDFAFHGGWVQCVVFAPNGKTVFTADSWGKLAAWDYAAAEPKPLWSNDSAHAAWIRNVAVSHDGKLVATASRDGLVRLRDAQTGKQVAELPDHNEDVYSVAFSPDGKLLASGDFMGKIKLWDVASRKCVRELDGDVFAALERLQDCGGVRLLSFVDGGKTLVAAGSEPVNGGTFQGYPTVATYDVATGKQTKAWRFGETKDGFVTDFMVCPSGDWMLVTSGVTGNGKLMLLKSKEDKPYVETTKVSNTHACSLHPDGKRFLLTCCNPNNSGNGAVKSKENMEYASNWSPVRFLELPVAGPTA